MIKNVKNTVPWTYVINDINGEEIVGTFSKKDLQKSNQKEFRIEKAIKIKGDKLCVKWKGYNNSLNGWIYLAHFPKPKSLGENVKVELNLSNYATKTDLKSETGVDASSAAKKTDLAHLNK